MSVNLEKAQDHDVTEGDSAEERSQVAEQVTFAKALEGEDAFKPAGRCGSTSKSSCQRAG